MEWHCLTFASSAETIYRRIGACGDTVKLPGVILDDLRRYSCPPG